jgi:phospholipid transport system substrate-binding protein
MIDRRFFLRGGAMLSATTSNAYAEDEASPTSLIERFAQTGISDILDAKISQREKTNRFRVLFKTFFDIPAIGRFVLGRFARAAAPDDLTKFQALFEDVVVYTWTRRFGEYNGQTLKVKDAAPDGDEGAIVNSAIVGKDGQAFAVAWRTRKRLVGHQIVDVIIEGVSMAITYRNEYAAVIQQGGGMPGLLSQIQKQVDDLAKKVDG